MVNLLDRILTRVFSSIKWEKEDQKNSFFMEKNRIYRMLSMAMVEDGQVSDAERQMMITIILRRYLDNEIRNDSFDEYCKRYHDITFDGVSNIDDKEENAEENKNTGEKKKKIPTSLCSLSYSDNNGDKHEITIDNKAFKWLIGHLIKPKLPDFVKNIPNEILGNLVNEIIEQKEDPDTLDYTDEAKEVLEKAFQYLKKNYIKELEEFALSLTKASILAHQVLNKCEEELNNKDLAAFRSQFSGIDRLTKKKKLQELIDLYAIIYADRREMDSEREAFRVICKLFKLNHSSLILQMAVNLFTKHEEKVLNMDPEKCFTDVSERQEYDVNDYIWIKEAIIKYDIKGPLKYGVYQIFTRDIMQHDEKTRKFDRKMSKIAITIFAVMSIILYTFVSDLLLHPHTSDSTSIATETTRIFELKQGKFDNILMSISLLVSDMSGDNKGLKTLYLSIKEHIGIISIVSCLILAIFTISSFVKMLKRLKIRYLKKQKLNYAFFPIIKNGPKIWFSLALLILILIFFEATGNELIETFFIPMVLLLMMLSIEWLIFMKSESHDNNEDKTKSKQHTDNTPLFVLTIVAILLDMGLGSVEWLLLEGDDYKMLTAKLTSAVVLGAICFFSGKFLEMYRTQQKQDRDTIEKCVDEIKKERL